MSFVVAFDRLAFQKHKTDPDTGLESIEPDGPEVIVRKGHRVPDWVAPWQLAALAQSGMIAYIADAAAEFVPAAPPALHAVPEAIPLRDPVTTTTTTGGVIEVTDPDLAEDSPEGPAEPVSPAPAPADSRAAWEEYATSPAVGMTEAEASSFPNKGALIAAVNDRTTK